jgi:hypothetical protein
MKQYYVAFQCNANSFFEVDATNKKEAKKKAPALLAKLVRNGIITVEVVVREFDLPQGNSLEPKVYKGEVEDEENF